MEPPVTKVIAQLGLRTREIFSGMGETFRFASISFRAFLDFQKWNRGASLRVIMDQARFTGLEAMPSITLISLILDWRDALEKGWGIVTAGVGEWFKIPLWPFPSPNYRVPEVGA